MGLPEPLLGLLIPLLGLLRCVKGLLSPLLDCQLEGVDLLSAHAHSPWCGR
jgi:hypothetical protein